VNAGIFILQSSVFRFGLDNVLGENLDGNIGIVTNSSGVTYDLEQNIEFLLRNGISVVKIFSPEHGFYGTEANGAKIEDSIYNGVTVISLYGDKVEPSEADLSEIDSILFDLQDAGVRFYTYISTLYNVMKACSRHDIPLIVCDRPNPINATVVDGPILADRYKSFVGIDNLPVRYGLTIGELAQFFNRKVHANLRVARMTGYYRNTYFDDLIPWFVPPSLNLPSVEAMINYSGLCLLEATNLSVGRGTPYPFSQFGFPAMKSLLFGTRGVKLRRTRFRPLIDPHGNEVVDGYFIHITDRRNYNPILLSLEIISQMLDTEGFIVNFEKLSRLYGSERIISYLNAGKSPAEISEEWSDDRRSFIESTKDYRLYS